LSCGIPALGGRSGYDALKSHLTHEIPQNHRKSRIVFDQQYDAATGRN
jgi:hypothetical protein